MTLQEAIDRYRDERPAFEAAALLITDRLKTICRHAGVVATADARAKDLGSFAKKVMTKPDYAADPWGMTTDKLGARVITETLRDRERVVEAITSSDLHLLRTEDKGAEAHANTLFYPGVHIQVVVPGAASLDGQPIECEVQVRTKAQDLWSVPSHSLLYKGVVEPPAEAARKLWRLSALIELFDEEVDRAMAEVLSTPRYTEAQLLAYAEPRYYTFVQQFGDRELSLLVLHQLLNAFPAEEDRAVYADQLVAFADDRRDQLTAVYRNYGLGSQMEGSANYWLFTQPESLLIFERIATHPHLLRAALRGTELEYAVEPLYDALGVPF